MHLFSAIAKFKARKDLDWLLIAEEWPTFLYDEQSGWSENKVQEGLFRGHVLVRVSAVCSCVPYHSKPPTRSPSVYTGTRQRQTLIGFDNSLTLIGVRRVQCVC